MVIALHCATPAVAVALDHAGIVPIWAAIRQGLPIRVCCCAKVVAQSVRVVVIYSCSGEVAAVDRYSCAVVGMPPVDHKVACAAQYWVTAYARPMKHFVRHAASSEMGALV